MSDRLLPEINYATKTDFIYDENCFQNPLDPEKPEDLIEGINRALKLDSESAFLEGVVCRLNYLGIKCSVNDTDIIVKEVRNRYKEVLGKNCPKTVSNWCNGGVTSTNNPINNYDVCIALGMDYRETAEFFQKHFLSMPYIIKNREDAVYMYCLYHKKTYQTVERLIAEAEEFDVQQSAHTETSKIFRNITEIDNDETFLKYLSEHCYDNKQRFQKARSEIKKEVDLIKKSKIKNKDEDDNFTENRMNSITVEQVLGYKYQKSLGKAGRKLPKRFTESLPNDVTLGKILNDDDASYETLRKALILFNFYNFYNDVNNERLNSDNSDDVVNNLLDFQMEINDKLNECGLAQIYVRHPFDCLVMYCANTYDPIDALNLLLRKDGN